MATSQPRREDPNQVLDQTIKVFQKFLEGPSRFAITNESMHAIVTTFGRRLKRAARRGRALPLLADWRRELPGARVTVMDAASTHPLRTRTGARVPLLTEDEAARLATLCPAPPQF